MNDNYSKRRINAGEWEKRRIDPGEREKRRIGPAEQANTGSYQPVDRKRRFNKGKFARTVILLICMIIAGLVSYYYFSGKILPASAQNQDADPMESEQAAGNALEGKLIVLDAGHGGFDVGATGVSGVFEDDLNLKVAQYLKADLEKKGAQVIMTREDENAIAETKDEDMAKRRQIIQQSGSDIVLSVHMNSETEDTFSGPIVLFMPGSIQGENLAKSIQQSLLELKPESQNSARAEELFITQSGTQPCVIVECGFLSNPNEEALLVRDDYQQKIAQAITDGCNKYFSANSGN